MARSRSSQTSPGQATYLLHVQLRVPAKPDYSKPLDGGGYERAEAPVFLNVGDIVTEDQLSGLRIAALVKGGALEKKSEPQVPCELCQEQGTKEQKAATYKTPAALEQHYRQDHAAFEPPTLEEV